MENKNLSEKKFIFWQTWLIVVSIMSIVIGLILFIGNDLLMSNYNNEIAKSLFGKNELPNEIKQYHKWMLSIVGSSIIGWGICYTYISLIPFKNKEKWAHKCITYSLLIWAILDSTISFKSGVYIEVIFNMIFVLLISLPLIFTFKYFK